MINRKAYSTQMSYQVTDKEKNQAKRALLCFNHTQKILEVASEHLNIMKTPFKENGSSNPDEVMNARAAMRRFRDKAVENFNNFKKAAFKCVDLMQEFSSDTQCVKMMKSFIASIDELENKVNQFVDLFSNLEDKDFTNNVVKLIEDIQKQCESVEDIIDNRVKKHIQNNILSSSWVDSVGDELEMKIQKKTPLILDLFNDRQEQLADIVKNRTNLGE